MIRCLVLTALYIAAEIFLFKIYGNHDSRFHWFTHFFIGGIVALTGMTIHAYRTGQAARLPLLWLLLGHVVAMFPDLLFNLAHIVHQSWMEVYLFHIVGHFIPGRNYTWYGLFMISLAIYLWTLHKKTTAKRQ